MIYVPFTWMYVHWLQRNKKLKTEINPHSNIHSELKRNWGLFNFDLYLRFIKMISPRNVELLYGSRVRCAYDPSNRKNSFNKTEVAVFPCRLCFLGAFPFYQFNSNFKGTYNTGKTQIDPYCYIFICINVQANKSTKSYN